MRPQELYQQVGMTHEVLRGITDQIRMLVAGAEVWDQRRLHVDNPELSTVPEVVDSVVKDLRSCAEAMDLAVGHLEAAWSASARLGDDG